MNLGYTAINFQKNYEKFKFIGAAAGLKTGVREKSFLKELSGLSTENQAKFSHIWRDPNNPNFRDFFCIKELAKSINKPLRIGGGILYGLPKWLGEVPDKEFETRIFSFIDHLADHLDDPSEVNLINEAFTSTGQLSRNNLLYKKLGENYPKILINYCKKNYPKHKFFIEDQRIQSTRKWEYIRRLAQELDNPYIGIHLHCEFPPSPYQIASTLGKLEETFKGFNICISEISLVPSKRVRLPGINTAFRHLIESIPRSIPIYFWRIDGKYKNSVPILPKHEDFILELVRRS